MRHFLVLIAMLVASVVSYEDFRRFEILATKASALLPAIERNVGRAQQRLLEAQGELRQLEIEWNP